MKWLSVANVVATVSNAMSKMKTNGILHLWMNQKTTATTCAIIVW